MLRKFPIATTAAIALFAAGAATANAASRAGYTGADKTQIETCLERAQRNSQHARTCIGAAALVCEQQPEMASNAGIKDCIYRENAYWDEMLNERYQRLMMAFSQQNAKKLQAMQRTWIAWRKQKCELPYMLYEGGSMASVMAASCFMTTTAIRAIELDEAAIAP